MKTVDFDSCSRISARVKSQPWHEVDAATTALGVCQCFRRHRHVPDQPYGPARRELAKRAADVAGDKLDTILLGDLSFSDEAWCCLLAVRGQAIRPLLVNLGLKVKLLESPESPDPKHYPFPQAPYPTTICQAGFKLTLTHLPGCPI